MRMQRNGGRNGGTEVLGTMSAVRAPLVQDFQFVKFRTTGEVARLTLDRPEHNLLNERMLAEVAAGINSLSERAEIKIRSASDRRPETASRSARSNFSWTM